MICEMELVDKLIEEIEELLSLSPNNDLTHRLLESYREFRKYVKNLSSAGF